ncbi:MAG: hypothetical protein KBC72_01910 [Acinetobacter sp.]|nr:hypothetical protein [Acinetobacter sp.]
MNVPKTIYLIAFFLFFMMGGYIRAIQHHLIAEFASQAFAEAVFIHHYAFYCATYSDCLFKSYSTDYWCSDYGAYVFIFGYAIYMGITNMPMIIGSFIMIALFSYCAWYCGRKRTLDLANMHAAYKKHHAIVKQVQKSLHQR